MLNKRQIFGLSGEAMALKHLKQKGYKVVEKNFRCKFGEIDIIAYDGPCLVFIEVKTRSSDNFGPPAASVNLRKQQQICKATHIYITDKKLTDCEIRFDVVTLLIESNRPPEIEIIANAFEYCL